MRQRIKQYLTLEEARMREASGIYPKRVSMSKEDQEKLFATQGWELVEIF